MDADTALALRGIDTKLDTVLGSVHAQDLAVAQAVSDRHLCRAEMDGRMESLEVNTGELTGRMARTEDHLDAGRQGSVAEVAYRTGREIATMKKLAWGILGVVGVQVLTEVTTKVIPAVAALLARGKVTP